MASNQPQQTVQRLEFSIVVSQLFLWIGLLALGTLSEGVGAEIIKWLAAFGGVGMGLVYSISANKARPKRPSPHDNPKQVD